jgi:hypothetical protein
MMQDASIGGDPPFIDDIVQNMNDHHWNVKSIA